MDAFNPVVIMFLFQVTLVPWGMVPLLFTKDERWQWVGLLAHLMAVAALAYVVLR